MFIHIPISVLAKIGQTYLHWCLLHLSCWWWCYGFGWNPPLRLSSPDNHRSRSLCWGILFFGFSSYAQTWMKVLWGIFFLSLLCFILSSSNIYLTGYSTCLGSLILLPPWKCPHRIVGTPHITNYHSLFSQSSPGISWTDWPVLDGRRKSDVVGKYMVVVMDAW